MSGRRKRAARAVERDESPEIQQEERVRTPPAVVRDAVAGRQRTVPKLDELYGTIVVKVNVNDIQRNKFIVRETNKRHEMIKEFETVFKSGGYGSMRQLVSIGYVNLPADVTKQMVDVLRGKEGEEPYNLSLMAGEGGELEHLLEGHSMRFIDGMHRASVLAKPDVRKIVPYPSVYLHYRLDYKPMSQLDFIDLGACYNNSSSRTIQMTTGHRINTFLSLLGAMKELVDKGEELPVFSDVRNLRRRINERLNFMSGLKHGSELKPHILKNYSVQSGISAGLGDKQAHRYCVAAIGMYRYIENCSELMNLVEEIGSLKILSVPQLWQTTCYFHQLFLLKTLAELRNAEIMSKRYPAKRARRGKQANRPSSRVLHSLAVTGDTVKVLEVLSYVWKEVVQELEKRTMVPGDLITLRVQSSTSEVMGRSAMNNLVSEISAVGINILLHYQSHKSDMEEWVNEQLEHFCESTIWPPGAERDSPAPNPKSENDETSDENDDDIRENSVPPVPTPALGQGTLISTQLNSTEGDPDTKMPVSNTQETQPSQSTFPDQDTQPTQKAQVAEQPVPDQNTQLTVPTAPVVGTNPSEISVPENVRAQSGEDLQTELAPLTQKPVSTISTQPSHPVVRNQSILPPKKSIPKQVETTLGPPAARPESLHSESAALIMEDTPNASSPVASPRMKNGVPWTMTSEQPPPDQSKDLQEERDSGDVVTAVSTHLRRADRQKIPSKPPVAANVVVSTRGEAETKGDIASLDELEASPAVHDSNGYVPVDLPAEAVVVEEEPDENGFRIIKRAPISEASDEEYVAYNYPRARLEGWTSVRLEEDAEIDQGGRRWYMGTVNELGGGKPQIVRLFEDRDDGIAVAPAGWKLVTEVEENAMEWEFCRTIPKCADTIGEQYDGLNYQKTLRVLGLRPPHRSFFLKEKAIMFYLRKALFGSMLCVYEDEFLFPPNVHDPNYDVAEQFVVQKCRSLRSTLDGNGFMVIPGLFKSFSDGKKARNPVLQGSMLDIHDAMKKGIHDLFNYFKELIPSEDLIESGDLPEEVRNIWTSIRNGSKTAKEVFDKRNRLSTVTRAVTTGLEFPYNKQKLCHVRYRALLETAIMVISCWLRLEWEYFDEFEELGGAKHNRVPLEMPDTGGRFITLLSKEAETQTAHLDEFVPDTAETTWNGSLKKPSYFSIITSNDVTPFWVATGSHTNIGLSNNAQKAIGRNKPMRMILIPPWSLLLVRSDLVHAGTGGREARGYHCLRYHVYLHRENLCFGDAINDAVVGAYKICRKDVENVDKICPKRF